MLHEASSRRSARSVDDDVGAVVAAAARLRRRSTPTTSPNPPARPASTPASASSKTAHSVAAPWPRPSRRGEEDVGRRLPDEVVLGARTLPSTHASKRSSIPATCRIHGAFALDDTTAVGSSFGANRRARTRPSPGTPRHRSPRSSRGALVLTVAEPVDGLADQAGRRRSPSGRVIPRDARNVRTPSSRRQAVDVLRRSRGRSRTGRTASRRVRHVGRGTRRTSASTPQRGSRPCSRARHRGRTGNRGRPRGQTRSVAAHRASSRVGGSNQCSPPTTRKSSCRCSRWNQVNRVSEEE